MNCKIDSLYIIVDDLERAIKFYEEFFEQKILNQSELGGYFDINGFRVDDPPKIAGRYTEKEQIEREKMETEKSLAKQTKELLDNGIPLTDIAKATKFSVEYFEHLLEKYYPQVPAKEQNSDIQSQLDFLKQQVHILQKKLDNTQSENIQLKQQVNTLQAKGVNMSEQVETIQGIQQWEYTSSRLGGGMEELKKLGDQGWEVVDGIKMGAGTEVVFKRPKPKQNKREPDYGYGR